MQGQVGEKVPSAIAPMTMPAAASCADIAVRAATKAATRRACQDKEGKHEIAPERGSPGWWSNEQERGRTSMAIVRSWRAYAHSCRECCGHVACNGQVVLSAYGRRCDPCHHSTRSSLNTHQHGHGHKRVRCGKDVATPRSCHRLYSAPPPLPPSPHRQLACTDAARPRRTA